MAELIKRPERAALDKAIADALPLSGGRVRVALHKLQVELARLDDPRMIARQADPHAHACVSCSPDGVLPGPGCVNCRQTGMDQTPCNAPGHQPQCPHGCCGGPRTADNAPSPAADRPEMLSDRLGYPPQVGDEDWRRIEEGRHQAPTDAGSSSSSEGGVQ